MGNDHLSFYKMHGIGNDFVLIDCLEPGGAAPLDRHDWPSLARKICDRHFGVGADGILLVAEPDRESAELADYRMIMFNPDGSEAEMCGNGIRCFARYVYEASATPRSTLRVQTGAGILSLQVRAAGGEFAGVTVDMGRPRLEASEIPVLAATSPVIALPLVVGGRELLLTCVSMGNPHAVAFVEEDVTSYPLAEIGPKVERDPHFPRRVNFEICRVLSRSELEVRVWERGAGLTLACGTGAAAVTVAARLNGLVDDRVRLHLPGGTLELEWDGSGDVYMTGPAAHVFRGEWAII